MDALLFILHLKAVFIPFGGHTQLVGPLSGQKVVGELPQRGHGVFNGDNNA
jgi:hypothetical protein